jgi:transposase-like protein
MLEEGYTIDYIKKQFGINDTQLKVMWVKYQRFGLSALEDRPANKQTPTLMKIAAVEDFVKKGLSLAEVCLKYDVDKSSIQRWKSKYIHEGVDAFIRAQEVTNMGRPKKKRPEEMTELERLRYENERLRAENALLKKVRALVEEREARLREIGQKPSKN